jgi:hypothetical protein
MQEEILAGPPPVIEAFEELQKQPIERSDVEWLVKHIEERAKEYGARRSASDYGRGLDAGMTTAFGLCAGWIRDDVLK